MCAISNKALSQEKIIPEWTIPKGIALVYPDRLKDNPEDNLKKSELIPFYYSFIQAIIDNADISQLTIIHRPGLKENLAKTFKSSRMNINLIEIGYVQDIWIRDWAPIAMSKSFAFKAKYFPQYFKPNEEWFAKQDDNAGTELVSKFLNIKIQKLAFNNEEIILDGGNFIHNGKGIGITTKRILEDNSLSNDEIKQTFKEQLDITKLIIVDPEPYDKTGHILME